MPTHFETVEQLVEYQRLTGTLPTPETVMPRGSTELPDEAVSSTPETTVNAMVDGRHFGPRERNQVCRAASKFEDSPFTNKELGDLLGVTRDRAGYLLSSHWVSQGLVRRLDEKGPRGAIMSQFTRKGLRRAQTWNK
jgi:hypothetical protein